MPTPGTVYADVSMPSRRPGPATPDDQLPYHSEDSSPDPDEYYANQDPEALSEQIIRYVQETKNTYRASGMYARARQNYDVFYSDMGGPGFGQNISTQGDMGGSMGLSVGVLKNAIDHLMNMVTSNRPAVDPVTLNSSTTANDVTTIAKAIIDYRLHKQKDIIKIDEALRQSMVLGAAYHHMWWDPFAGSKSSDPTPRKGQGVAFPKLPSGQATSPTIFRGDSRLEALSLLDVFYDISAKSWDETDDCVIRVYRNRHALIAQYPEAKEDLLQAPPRSYDLLDEYLPNPTRAITQQARTPAQEAQIELHVYYHKRNAACAHGRTQIQLPSGKVLDSDILPEWLEFPVYRTSPETMIGSAHGISPVTSSGGLQEALNMGSSALLTNMAAFSRRLMLAQKDMDVEAVDITGDLKMLEVEFGADGKPPIQMLDLLGNQNGLVEMLNWFVGQIEQVTGVNAVARGDPAGVTAGVAINLYQSMALQFASPVEAARADAIMWYATSTVKGYQAHPDVERDVRVTGAAKATALRNFYGKDLAGIDSFTVDPGNPATRTLAMRYNMAMALKQDGVPIPPDKIVHLMRTGDWDSTVEGPESLDNIIRIENESLMAGRPVHAIPGDDPVRHAQGHAVVLADLRVRNNPQIIQVVMAHMQEHLQSLMTGDPVLKLMAGSLPMGPFPPPGSPLAHGDTPAPNHPIGPPPPHMQQGPPSGQAPGRKIESPKLPPAPPAPGIPGIPA